MSAAAATTERALDAVVADDSALLREAVADVLERAGIQVVARAATVAQLLRAVERHAPDVAVVDVRFPPDYRVEGLEAALGLRDRGSRLGIVILSQHVEPAYAARLVRTGGGIGYLLKDRVASVAEFVAGIRTVAAGGCVLDPEVGRALIEPARARGRLDRLTPRELEVLGLMAEGRSNRGITEALRLSERTVEVHIASVFRGLDLEESGSVNRRVLAVLTYLGTLP